MLLPQIPSGIQTLCCTYVMECCYHRYQVVFRLYAVHTLWSAVTTDTKWYSDSMLYVWSAALCCTYGVLLPQIPSGIADSMLYAWSAVTTDTKWHCRLYAVRMECCYHRYQVALQTLCCTYGVLLPQIPSGIAGLYAVRTYRVQLPGGYQELPTLPGGSHGYIA